MPEFARPRRVSGYNLLFRCATPGDASFILSLRTDPVKSKYLSPTSNDIERQVEWLKEYESDLSQVYFIIEGHGLALGTVRLYDPRERSFCWGSWIIRNGAPASAGIESALMVYAFGRSAGFNSAHFEVNKENTSVWKFHERFGARRIGEDGDSFQYKIDADTIKQAGRRYAKYLPDGIEVW